MTLPTTIAASPPTLPRGDKKLFAEVVVNLPVRETFTYEIPSRFRGILQKGMRVFVPFGRRKLTGYVVDISENRDPSLTLKPVEDILDTHPVLSEEILSLTRWIADYYQSSWGEAVKAALPAGLEDESQEILSLSPKGLEALEIGKENEPLLLILDAVKSRSRISPKQLRRSLHQGFSAYALARAKEAGFLQSELKIRRSTVQYKYEKQVRVIAPAPDRNETDKLLQRSPRQKAVYEDLLTGEKTISELAQKFPACSAALKKLLEKGLVEINTVKIHRQDEIEEQDPFWMAEAHLPFTPDQEKVFSELKRSLDASEFKACLLHGITGSGKTEIYIRCIHRALELGKTAIMMVPEISLTPQTVNRLQKRFGRNVAIMHSGLSQRERYQEWKKIQEGRVAIVIGARSAVFSPLKNLGVIVIDEEHDSSYKQDSTPRYHARDTAIVRAQAEKAIVILGSATPSMESLANTESGKYQYLSLGKRVLDRLLPVVKITDMRKEKDEYKNFSILSGELKTAIRSRLDRREQVFLFLNRRGTANYIFCKECGFVFECPHCSVTLTFHGNENVIRCHYCNYSARAPKTCADCQGEVIRFNGFGTQKLEEETRRLFPQAKITRLDRDTARGKSAFEAMHQLMSAGEIDILIGTQMITKGHDFPNVTLVGVVHADLSLNIPDFRSCERSFQLLTQVAGRAGRGRVPGQVIIQTHKPEHYVFDFVREHDFHKFYEKELAYRKQLNYPPFTRMVALEIESEIETLGESTTRKLKQALSPLISSLNGVELIGPSRAALYRIKNKYRWHLLLRARSARTLQSLLDRLKDHRDLKTLFSGKVKLIIDVDPINLM